MITAIEETNFIVLHQMELNISEYSLKDKYQQKMKITKYLHYPKHQQVRNN